MSRALHFWNYQPFGEYLAALDSCPSEGIVTKVVLVEAGRKWGPRKLLESLSAAECAAKIVRFDGTTHFVVDFGNTTRTFDLSLTFNTERKGWSVSTTVNHFFVHSSKVPAGRRPWSPDCLVLLCGRQGAHPIKFPLAPDPAKPNCMYCEKLLLEQAQRAASRQAAQARSAVAESEPDEPASGAFDTPEMHDKATAALYEIEQALERPHSAAPKKPWWKFW